MALSLHALAAWLRRSMDRTKVSGTFDVGSIPAGAILKKRSVSLMKLGVFLRAAPDRTKKTFSGLSAC